MITEQQENNIHNLPIEDILRIAEICNEALGVVTKEDYAKIMNIPERTVYENINNGKIICLDVCGKKFPSVNLNLGSS